MNAHGKAVEKAIRESMAAWAEAGGKLPPPGPPPPKKNVKNSA